MYIIDDALGLSQGAEAGRGSTCLQRHAIHQLVQTGGARCYGPHTAWRAGPAAALRGVAADRTTLTGGAGISIHNSQQQHRNFRRSHVLRVAQLLMLALGRQVIRDTSQAATSRTGPYSQSILE